MQSKQTRLTDVPKLNNEQIRHKILLFLYRKFQEGSFFDTFITQEVIKQLDIPADDITYKNLDYLEQAGYIYGLTPNGYPCPQWIRIETQGMDLVESKEPEYANLHWNIRFKILSVLYNRHFSVGNEETIPVNPNIIREFDSMNINQNLILTNVIYLHQKKLITGYSMFGFAYPPRIKIDTSGIGYLEKIVDDSLHQLANTVTDTALKTQVEEAIQEEDKVSKLERLRKIIGENAAIIELVANVVKSFIGF